MSTSNEAAARVRSWSPTSRGFLPRILSRDIDLPRLRARTLAVWQRLATVQSEITRCHDELNSLSAELGRQQLLIPDMSVARLNELESVLASSSGDDLIAEEQQADLREILEATKQRLVESSRLTQELAGRQVEEADRATIRREEIAALAERHSALRTRLEAISDRIADNDQAAQQAEQYAHAETRRLRLFHNAMSFELSSRKLDAELEIMTALVDKLSDDL